MMRCDSPLVSVIMPAHNAEAYIALALESILEQTYRNLEVIVLDDGSCDDTWHIVGQYQDDRLVCIRADINRGVVATLNEGLMRARGRYIARMDADDIAKPHRIARQVAFMESRPDFVVCASSVIYFNPDRGECKVAFPQYHAEIMACLALFQRWMCHPSALLRRSCLVENNITYQQKYEHAEDYQLWVAMARYGKLHNLAEPLLHYRVHSQQITVKHRPGQLQSSRWLLQQQLEPFLRSASRVYHRDRYIDYLLLSQYSEGVSFTVQEATSITRELLDYCLSAPQLDNRTCRAILILKLLKTAYLCNYSMISKVRLLAVIVKMTPGVLIKLAIELRQISAIGRLKTD
ncbi:Putative glycosyltransferase EpsE [BD1-7 clade bacterium]|uniref:Glycosyltransferase EpsE n=1 Tax=BD1-7 clade bacterium TaxID=2029982 RepID=A0A5S9QNK9_9GAMM|nr:Putative glycosyltransferase EpsE [BD1-7 clade bacterium]CAA0121459.1 Putative glycosyltransferase EpsE [BD1-7 clade bacterium]